MKPQLPQDINKYGNPPLISFNPGPKIRKKPDIKYDSLNVIFNTQLEEKNSKIVLLYISIFNNRSTKELFKFLMILKNSMKGKNLNNIPQCYYMTNHILDRESILFFKHKYRGNGENTMTN